MKVLVLAGGIPQAELIKKLREKFIGVKIILADYSEHPYAEKFADKFYRESTLNVEAIEKIAREEKVDFLITVCTDQALNTVAEVSERLGLPCYINAETGKNVTNKRYMKKVFEENQIPSAKYIVLNGVDLEKLKGFSFPLVVKPVDCNSSKGVIKVKDELSLKNAIANAIEYSRTNQAIVEEFIEGTELSVDAYVHDGEPTVLCVSESQKVKSEQKFLIFRSVYPSGISNETKEDIKVIVKKIAKAFNLKNCPMLIQMLYKNGKLYVVEFSARTGGGLKFQLIEQVSKVDVINCAIEATVGESKIATVKIGCRYVVNEFMYCNKGVYNHLEGFNELKENNVICDYRVFKNAGTLMDKIENSGDRIASFTLTADSFEELNEKYQTAISNVKVIDDKGNDILHHGLTYPINKR